MEFFNDVMAYVEMFVFIVVVNYLGSKYLCDCILYVMLELCVMCVGVFYWG